ncbi:unnamed protein product [Soboliphyme baturini]|uniref:AMP_N domain-containing protein n=1 Tax=Soboliphyme baturini TaxID=241478 RepID=A0A183ITA7_9BILA|nr:unnamed protein product [Soboliphyme baturini]
MDVSACNQLKSIVSNALFSENRLRLKTALNRAGFEKNVFVFVEGGHEKHRYNTDMIEGDALVFRQESYFFWCFGVVEPGFYGAIDLASGKSYLFMPQLPESCAVWYGKIFDRQHFKEKYEVDAVFHDTDIVEELKTLKAKKILLLVIYSIF